MLPCLLCCPFSALPLSYLSYTHLSTLCLASFFFSLECPHLALFSLLAGHPFHGWPARLRGHKFSGLWKVWTVPSPPLPSPTLPCPALPCPALPSPALPSPSPPLPAPPLPCPALHSTPLPSPPLPPSLPPSLPPACQIWSSWVQPKPLFRVRPRSNLAALWITAETFGPVMTALVWRHPAAMIDCAKGQRKHFCLKSRISRAVIGMGTNEWPSPLPEG